MQELILSATIPAQLAQQSKGEVNLNGTGYYDIDANITLTAGAAGTVIVSLYKDGVPITGATASATATESGIISVSIPAVVRNMCCCGSVITAILTGVAATITNAAIAVEKI